MMPRALIACAVLALSACGPSGDGAPAALTAPAPGGTSPAQLEQVVHGFLDRAQQQYAPDFAKVDALEDHIVALQPGQDNRWPLTLTGGVAYRIIGACDNECRNLDLELLDAGGAIVASDSAPDDFPLLSFTPPANGAFTLRTVLQTCTVAPCYVGARVLVRAQP